jgi:hypothetical protein
VAVIQLSRIQIRRGQKNQGTGLPQLASGELGWAVDTQELYIGNGSLTEGAPIIGNSKILTEHDNIFSLSDAYSYKEGDAHIQTGESPSAPTKRSLQSRLDDQVSIKNFGVVADENIGVGASFQRAIDELYINSATKGDPTSRVILFVDPGIYNIDVTLYIPPYATIIGAGPDKTILKFTNSSVAMMTVNELSTPGNPAIDESAVDSATTFNNQARFIQIENLSIQAAAGQVGLHVNSCSNSRFNNLKITSSWAIGSAIPAIVQGALPTNTGILLDSLSTIVKTDKNVFYNCNIENFAYGVSGNQNITNNVFSNCKFLTLGKGVYFGAQQNGNEEIPKFNKITNSIFKDIHDEGILIERGVYNQSEGNHFSLVGNHGGNEYLSETPVITMNTTGNESIDDYFTRTDILRTEFTVPSTYVAEVTGNVNQVMGHTVEATIYTASTPTNIIRFPAEQNQSYEIEYYMYNQSYDLQRTGKLNLLCDKTGLDKVYITDSYDQIGDVDYDTPDTYLIYDIYFSAEFVNDGTASDPVYSIYLKATSSFAAPTYFRYKLVNHKLKI